MAILNLAAKGLLRKKFRTFLTITGITLAISFTVGLLSISEGFLLSFEKTLNKRGVDIFVFSKESKIKGNMMFMGLSSKGLLPESHSKKLQEISGVEFVVPVCVVYSSSEIFTMELPFIVDGIDVSLIPKLRPYAEIESGRMLNKQDKYGLLLGYNNATDKNLKVGDKYTIIDKDFTVVGIMKQQGTLVDWKVNAPIKTMQEISGKIEKVDYFMIKAKDVGKIDKLSDKIKRKFPDLTTYTLQELITHFEDMLTVVRAIHFSVACVALLIGVLFVACTMIMSVSERIKEFATLRVIGASRKAIFQLVIFESTTLSIIAGILGCFGGWCLSKIITLLVKEFAHTSFIQTVITPRILLYGIVISILIGTISGFIPAYQIAKRNIAEALRSE